MGRLEGKVAIVTGAGRGHAEAVARRFAKEGAAVSICDVLPVEELEAKVGSEIRAAGGDVICFETDVSQEEPVNEMVAGTIENSAPLIYSPTLSVLRDRRRMSGT